MPAVHRISDEQRRARLAWRHRLAGAARTGDVVALTRSLVALHSSDPATVHLTAAVRMPAPAIEPTGRALYEDRSVVRMLGMRRTLFVVPRGLMAIVQAASTNDIAIRERQRLLAAMEDNGIADPDAALGAVERSTLEALEAHGSMYTSDLTAVVPALGQTITIGSGRWTASVRLSSRVLFVLAAQGHILRGRPRGTWRSSQYRWTSTVQWLGCRPVEQDPEHARVELARRWLERFGPGTLDDLVWWTGWTKTRTRRALAALDPVEVQLDDGATGFVLASDVDTVEDPQSWAALLPGLDPTPMGWKHRAWYLGPHANEVFDRNGNVGPTVWWNGRIVGGWAQRPDATIAYRLLADIGADGIAEVEAEVARLQPMLADVVVTPRFRSPLDKALAG